MKKINHKAYALPQGRGYFYIRQEDSDFVCILVDDTYAMIDMMEVEITSRNRSHIADVAKEVMEEMGIDGKLNEIDAASVEANIDFEEN